MEIKDLNNCPDWLLNVYVIGEDIEINNYGRVIWKGGIWEDGIWKGGTWKGGIWEGSIWEGGRCKWSVYINKNQNTIHIGCKENSIEGWDLWFASNEEYETMRNTEQFKRIYNAYLVAKFRLELELKSLEI